MKPFLTAVCLLLVLITKAQIVNIPDSNFKNYLINAGIDLNSDGNIQVPEAAAVINFPDTTPVNGRRITDFTGIKSFVNMRSFRITHDFANAAALNLDSMPNLEAVTITRLGIVSLTLAGCPVLRVVNLTPPSTINPDISSVNASGCINLDSLTWNGYRGGNWEYAHSLNVMNCAKLKFLNVQSGLFDRLDLSTCHELTTFNCFELRVNTIDVRGLRKLTSIWETHDTDTLFAMNCVSLTDINLHYGNNLPGGPDNGNFVYVDGCTSLRSLNCWLLDQPSLDLSTCTNLKKLTIFQVHPGPYAFNFINLKNGSRLDTLDLCCLSEPVSICADEFEIQYLYDQLRNSIGNITIGPYCSLSPGGRYNTIQGIARIDENNNGCDVLDRGIGGVGLRITDTSGNTFFRYTSSSGDYAHYPYKGRFSITPYFPYPFYTVSPDSSVVTFDTANNLSNTTSFCVRPDGVHNDLEITFLPIWRARPGFNVRYALVYKNRGTTTLSGNVQVDFDNSKMNFTQASILPTSQSLGQVSWDYTNLLPFESRQIEVAFNILPPPTNNNGDTITFLASINPSANDETAFDNSFFLPQLVRGSVDPNEKECLEGGKIDISRIGEYLHYMVHFQNEGSDTAFNVVVVDTLSDNLDWKTFELLNSSHSCAANIKNNKAEFIFENIKLPYKAINEPASHGYVAFKIKPKPSVIVGDSLNNTAAIYFDFNLPVITNRATTVVTSSSTPVAVKLEYFNAGKKENGNWLHWRASCIGEHTVFVIERSSDGIHFSSIGAINTDKSRCQLPYHFIDHTPMAGKNYYRLKVKDTDGSSMHSKTVMINNNKTMLAIIAVSNGIVYFNSPNPQQIKLQVLASDGKLVHSDSKNIMTGLNQMNLQMKNGATGIYTLILVTEEGTIAKRFSR